jgi:hypothetical protein
MNDLESMASVFDRDDNEIHVPADIATGGDAASRTNARFCGDAQAITSLGTRW